VIGTPAKDDQVSPACALPWNHNSDAPLLDRARKEALRRGMTLTALIEQGLRLVLRRAPKPPGRGRITLPVCRAGSGTLPGVDLNDTSSLIGRMVPTTGPDLLALM